jgi:putative IMPACT (imprinted ancient) family translation regulator
VITLETNKTTAKRSQFSRHEALIIRGERQAVEGWLDAAVECRDKFRGNASEYARASVTDYHTVATIRQYVGACLKALRQYGNTPSKVMDYMEFKVGYGYANMDDLRRLVADKSKGKSPVRFSAKREAEKLGKKYTKAQLLEVIKYLK